MKKISCLFFGLLFTLSCARKQPEPAFTSLQISQIISKMTDVMVHDVTNPPLAARFFAYACLAGYEVVAQHDRTAPGMFGVLNQYPRVEKPAVPSGYSYSLSALLAMLETAQKMQPSGALLANYQQQFLDSCRQAGMAEEVITHSLAYAQAVSKQILAYAKADGYRRISNYPRYAPTNQARTWYPTPPGYFAPVEPYFNTVRPFTLDTCAQFKPAPPVAFSPQKNSAFFQLLQAAYQEGITLPKEHRAIAAFWDCNPFALQDNGHMLVGMKKISPGAHWLGITGIACRQARVNFAQALRVHTLVSVALTDGFIACWDEKFRSNRIRPETAIRKYLDPKWHPFLQTPPFPEYLSGHSTISAAAAVVLTHYFGDNFTYQDTVEVRFGLPTRQFASFQQAATEAGISRFYGGIHFMDAIENGRQQGLRVGEWVVNKVARRAGSPTVARMK